MRILVLGSGAREHALVWKLSQSAEADTVFCIPGNAGIAQTANCFNIALSDFSAIRDFIERQHIDFTVVGPEQPLADGIVDFLEAGKHTVFGPSKAAARIEGSKIFSKNLMQKYGIPTAKYRTFANFREAENYLKSLETGPIVVKADGLATGKGSVVCDGRETARDVLKQMMVEKRFADSGNRVVIEEFMHGQEASLFVITDGEDYRVLSPAQDYKRALDGDRGKNTGGMGSYAPTPILPDVMLNRSISEIVEPTLTALQSERIIYTGILYCGLMITTTGPKVVEFNCRFGDPETQVVLPLLDGDLLEILLASARKKLGSISVKTTGKYAVCVTLASGGYPDAYEKGKVISGFEEVDPDILLFHAGTKTEGNHIVTNGGRVLSVTAVASALKEAADKVYQNISHIRFDKMHYRKDIAEKGWKLLA